MRTVKVVMLVAAIGPAFGVNPAAAQDQSPEPGEHFLVPHAFPAAADSPAATDGLRPSGVDSAALFAPALLVRSGRPSWHDPFTNLPGDWASAGAMTISTANLPAIAGIAALTGALILTDRKTYDFSQHAVETSPFVRKASDAAVNIGEGSTHLGIAAVFAAYGFIADDSRALRTASQTVEALLATGITVQVMKRISGRESPAIAGSSAGKWRPFPNLRAYQKDQPKYYAFPSGHIATTMATLTVIAENYPEQTWIRPAGYILVAGLGISLVNVRYHWYSDLPLGIALGYTFGLLASRRGEEHAPAAGVRMMILPSLQEDGAGMTFALVF
jgi:membrane-associated phospholipid phosphatase